jgi:hypothetical protein
MSTKKSSNTNLRKANKAKNDEFYTQLSDIEKELGNYKDHLKNKVVFCNCDDPEESNFWNYFAQNFEHLGIKKLVSTHYESEKPSYKLEIIADINDDGKINKLDTVKTPLQQNGDFRSPECIEILQQADIVVTNPPFSLFREYVAQLMEYEKKFIIIGNLNAITYKEIFKLIKENKIWPGSTLDGRNIWFRIPDVYEKYHKIEDGAKYAFVAGTIWFTNLDHKKRHQDLILYKTYHGSEHEYPKYDNYDAINIDKSKDIPLDYSGNMGVPITFLLKRNPNQFEIIGQGQGNLYRELTPNGLSNKFVDDYYRTGGTGSIKEDHPVLGYYSVDGKAVIPYMRIIIKNKKL